MSETQAPESSFKHGAQERTRQAHNTPATHDIPYKSILMARVEEKFTGFNYLDLVHQYTQMGFSLEDILSECARMSLTAVADKCRAEAYRSACTQNNTPDLNSMNALEAAHRKLVYSSALSKVHPSKFYCTVPSCETCFQLYSCLDSLREIIVFLRMDSNTNAIDKTLMKFTGDIGVTESTSHVKSEFSSANSSRGENNYYKNLQKSLSRCSREVSDEVYSIEQQKSAGRLAEPKYRNKKFTRPSSASGGRPTSRSSGEDTNVVRPRIQSVSHSPFSGRPQTAAPARRDMFLDRELSDRRSSKLPFESNRKQVTSQKTNKTKSKYVAKKRAISIDHQLETVDDVSSQEVGMDNNSSYFAGDTEDEQQSEKSSYLLLANSVPRIHCQSGPLLGKSSVSFSGDILSRENGNPADPDKSIVLKTHENIKRAENVETVAGTHRIVVADGRGAISHYNNLQYVHSL